MEAVACRANGFMETPVHAWSAVRSRAGMTLVELLVAVTVVVALLAILLPAVQLAREAARQISCLNNLRGMACAIYGYESARRTFPVGCLECTTKAPRKQISWNVFILPFLEEPGAAAFDFKNSYRSQENRKAAGQVVRMFLCPSTWRTRRTGPTTGDRNRNGLWEAGDDLAYTDYGGIFGVGYSVPVPLPEHAGVMQYERSTTARQVVDGLSQTALVAECTGRDSAYQSEWANGQNIFDQWYTNGINVTQNNEIWSDHPGMAGLVFCDGHVEFVRDSVEQAVLLARLTRAAGDRVQ
jgi:prepilin-type processing-associated H-X9-DG protein